MKWTNKGRQFDDIARNVCVKDGVYMIWGAGTFGVSFFKTIKDRIEIIGFIDRDKEKQRAGVSGLKVYAPEELATINKLGDQKIRVIVANGWIKECFDYLSSCGYVRNKDCFVANEFLMVYKLYNEDKIYAISVNVPINTVCTLNCEKCMALIPYARKKENFDKKKIFSDVDAYFRWVDYVCVLGIGGGDSLLHPDLIEIVDYIGSKYKGTKLRDIEIYTNAIIMPTKELISVSKKYDVIFRFSDYSKNLSGIQKIDEFIEILDTNGLRYDRAKWETWYDTGFPQKNNGIVGADALEQHYNRCITNLCSIIYNGRMYFCSVCASAVIAGFCPERAMDSFDLDYDDSRRKAFIEFNAGYCEQGFLSWCTRCNGYQNINECFVPVAQQIEDLKKRRDEICQYYS